MKRNARFLLAVIGATLILQSCGSSRPVTVPPIAINTISTATFADMKLERQDYEILDRITTEATVIATYEDNEYTIRDEEGTFKFEYEWNDELRRYVIENYEGVIRLGYLSNDYTDEVASFVSPESAVRRIAIYRAISIAKDQGADGIIDPLVSTNFSASTSRDELNITYQTTVTGKLYRLKTDAQLPNKNTPKK